MDVGLPWEMATGCLRVDTKEQKLRQPKGINAKVGEGGSCVRYKIRERQREKYSRLGKTNPKSLRHSYHNLGVLLLG